MVRLPGVLNTAALRQRRGVVAKPSTTLVSDPSSRLRVLDTAACSTGKTCAVCTHLVEKQKKDREKTKTLKKGLSRVPSDEKLEVDEAVTQAIGSSRGRVELSIMEGQNLLPMDDDHSSDPYCVVGLGFSEEMSTHVVKKSLMPFWGTVFSFVHVSESHEAKVVVWDKDIGSSDDYMGEVIIPVKDMPEGKYSDGWYDVLFKKANTAKGRECGRIRIRTFYEPSGQDSSSLGHNALSSAWHSLVVDMITKEKTLSNAYNLEVEFNTILEKTKHPERSLIDVTDICGRKLEVSREEYIFLNLLQERPNLAFAHPLTAYNILDDKGERLVSWKSFEKWAPMLNLCDAYTCRRLWMTIHKLSYEQRNLLSEYYLDPNIFLSFVKNLRYYTLRKCATKLTDVDKMRAQAHPASNVMNKKDSSSSVKDAASNPGEQDVLDTLYLGSVGNVVFRDTKLSTSQEANVHSFGSHLVIEEGFVCVQVVEFSDVIQVAKTQTGNHDVSLELTSKRKGNSSSHCSFQFQSTPERDRLYDTIHEMMFAYKLKGKFSIRSKHVLRLSTKRFHNVPSRENGLPYVCAMNILTAKALERAFGSGAPMMYVLGKKTPGEPRMISPKPGLITQYQHILNIWEELTELKNDVSAYSKKEKAGTIITGVDWPTFVACFDHIEALLAPMDKYGLIMVQILAWNNPPLTLVVMLVSMYILYSGILAWAIPVGLIGNGIYLLMASYKSHPKPPSVLVLKKKEKDPVPYILRDVQNIVGGISTGFLKVLWLYTWSDVSQSTIVLGVSLAVAIATAFVPIKYILMGVVFAVFVIIRIFTKYPRLKKNYDVASQFVDSIPETSVTLIDKHGNEVGNRFVKDQFLNKLGQKFLDLNMLIKLSDVGVIPKG